MSKTIHARTFGSLATTDAARRTRDSVLTPPTAAETRAWLENAAKMSGLDLGRVRNGEPDAAVAADFIRDLLGAMRPETRDAVLKRLDAEREIGNAQRETDPGTDPGSPTRVTHDAGSLRDWRDRQSEEIRGLNEAARKRWSGR